MQLKTFTKSSQRLAEVTQFVNFVHPKPSQFGIELVGLGSSQTNFVPNGVFTDYEKFAMAAGLLSVKKGYNVYYGLARILDSLPPKHNLNECYERTIERCADRNVHSRNLFLIDLDPARPTGTASRDAQLEAAKDTADKVIAYLAAHGWKQPVIVFSGNGFHLLYKSAPNLIDETNKSQWSWILKHIAKQFPAEQTGVVIDVKVSNPSRIARLPGFANLKANRDAFVLSYPAKLEINIINQLAIKMGWTAQKKEDTVRGIADEEKIEQFAAQYPNHVKIEDVIEEPQDGRTYYALEICPHAGYRHRGVGGKHGCSHLILFDDGRVGFNCYKDDCNITISELIRNLEAETGIPNKVRFFQPPVIDITGCDWVEDI